LRRVDPSGSSAAFYVYDASGQRVRKVWEKAPGLTEERIYLGGFEIFRRHTGPIGANSATLGRETLHVMDDKQRIALVETRTLDTAGTDQASRQLIRYQFGNYLGSSSLELDDRALIISYEEYAPYGNSTYQAVRSQTETAKRYRYTGKERDEESGLYYLGARYYAAWLGRWTRCDPLDLVDGSSLYVAFKDMPVVLIDPNGSQTQDPQTVVTMPDNSKALGREVHQAVLGSNKAPGPLPQRLQAGLGNYGTASAEVPTGPGGSMKPRSKAPGRKDLTISTTRGEQIYDLKPEGRTQGVRKQLFNYGQRSTGGVASRAGTDRLTQVAPNVLDPVSIDKPGVKRDVLLSQPEAPGQVTYQVIEKRQVKAPVVEYRNRPATPPPAAPQAPAPASAPASPPLKTEAQTVVQAEAGAEAKAVVSSEINMGASAARGEARLLARVGGAVGVVSKALWALNIYFAWESYKEGTRPNTPAPVGNGMIGGSQGEGMLNAAGMLAGGAPLGTMLRQAAEFGSTGADPKKVWDAIRSGTASPTSIGMGIYFGAFR
jgi:RHS repeat-associated protein